MSAPRAAAHRYDRWLCSISALEHQAAAASAACSATRVVGTWTSASRSTCIVSTSGRAGGRGRTIAVSATAMTAIVPAWTGSLTTRSTWSVIEPTMLRAMIGIPAARSSSAARLISPPMIEPASTSSRARGRSATARTADAIASSPTSGIVSTEIRSPRRLCRSASDTAPSATWATCAPPPDDDHALAEDLGEGSGQADGERRRPGPRARRSARARPRRRSRPRAPAPRSAGRRARCPPTASGGRSTASAPGRPTPRRAPAIAVIGPGQVDDLEVDGDGGRQRLVRGAARASAASARSAGDDVADRDAASARAPVGSCSSNASRAPRTPRASRPRRSS